MQLRDILFSGNIVGLQQVLATDPRLADEGIDLPDNKAIAHPLHRLCDGVARKLYPEDVALEMARLLLASGADVNGGKLTSGQDSPLTAAASLRCDKLALLYLQHGANIHHDGCHGGTAVHWAAWCGRDVLVSAFVNAGSDINRKCHDFQSTPLFWASHGWKFGGPDNKYHQRECARILLQHGADKNIPNHEGFLPSELVDDDPEWKALLQ